MNGDVNKVTYNHPDFPGMTSYPETTTARKYIQAFKDILGEEWYTEFEKDTKTNPTLIKSDELKKALKKFCDHYGKNKEWSQIEKAAEIAIKEKQQQDTAEHQLSTQDLREYPPPKNLDEFRQRVLEELSKDRGEATESIVSEILNNNYIYTTRNDQNPEMWIYQEGIYKPEGETYIREFSRKVLGKAHTTHLINNVVEKIKASTYIDAKELFTIENLDEIPLMNGILNLRTRELTPYTPEKKFFTKLPLTYHQKANCPNIQKFLTEVVKHEQDLPLIQEMIGASLYRKFKWVKMFMLEGTGRNGKSILLNIIKRFYGPENCVSIPLHDLEEKEYAPAELHNKLANLGGEVNPRSLKSTGKVKQITGGDLIGCNRKYKNYLYFESHAGQIFSTNQIPIVYDDTVAWWERWAIIQFPFTFLPQNEIDEMKEEDRKTVKLCDTHILDKITTQEELNGLLNWALDGLDRLFQNDSYSTSLTSAQVANMWKRKSNSVEGFIMDELKPEWGTLIIKSELQAAYTQYCIKHGLKLVSPKIIKKTLESVLGVGDERKVDSFGVQQHCWSGIMFKNGEKDGSFSKNSQGCQDCHPDIHPKQISNLPKVQNTLTNMAKLTTEYNVIEDNNDSY